MRHIFLVLAFFGLAGCQEPEEGSIYNDQGFSRFIDLHCEARNLKDERFTLAEKLRKDTAYVSNPDSLKKALAAESRQLADSIREELSALTSEMSLEDKRAFNDSVKAHVERRGCK
jgi:hypothetical protein